MNLFLRGVCCIAWLFVWMAAHAQLVLNTSVKPKQAELFIRTVPSSVFNTYVADHGTAYEYTDGSIDKPSGTTGVSEGQTAYGWQFKGTHFYSYVTAFRSDSAPPPQCLPSALPENALSDSECRMAVRNFAQCHLFLINPKRELIAVQPLHIPQPDYLYAKPSCYDVYAMAPAKVVKDGMLIVASYYNSDWICTGPGPWCASGDPRAGPDPLYKTTFLVRFDLDAEGKLTTRQDDDCLKPLNKFDTIDKARKALTAAGCK